ncbi:hypothetical protein BsIDN1_68520 [Bacillus safensis]|uniref:PTS EIIA type-2 domain-containing protein n=1 Tax=Bacillus safensis TaxID=561879 RepID=A0A5S9MLU7_BACIA|nr:hypothetical protein BsIDN1_68520 [Bacillus safensis]
MLVKHPEDVSKKLQSLYQFLVRLTERKEVVEQLIKAASFEELTAALQVLEHPNEKNAAPISASVRKKD